MAAGGGSIVEFDGIRYKVGPESAGAYPGPACYGNGGPATVTDCNVLIGVIRPEFFPALFGEEKNLKIDKTLVVSSFEKIAESARPSSTRDSSIFQVAEGLLDLAVEKMANAIKKISVQRGYDVTSYTLQCFGGAGGQHACLVADALGMERIFIHPFAGVLSAYGMGLADIRHLKEQQFERPLSDHDDALKALQHLAQEAKEQVKAAVKGEVNEEAKQ